MDNPKRTTTIGDVAQLALMLVTIGVAILTLCILRVNALIALLMIGPLGLGVIDWVEQGVKPDH
jgi:hypothetical protein